ncbi:MAG: DNA cytosine methyltransferase [Candidatus Moranbacteria bacterium]|nr:DNA cytosine methyltransferase [Candidatus Moranbacteria bacterium]
MDSILSTIDLFAGIGGIRKGFERAGFETLYAADIDAGCKVTYDLNYKNTPLTLQSVTDIVPETLPNFGVLLAGFPCQSFSVAGGKAGFADKGRGDLFFEIMKVLEVKKPAAVFLENVKHLAKHDHGRTFVIIKELLERCGYHVKFAMMNSAEYGNVPQNRDRIYIVGFRDMNVSNAFEFPSKKILEHSITDLLETDVPEKYYYKKGWLYDRIKSLGMKRGLIYQWRRVYLRENKSGVCFTLTANMGMGGHNVPLVRDAKGLRRLTPRECAHLQGFPKGFKLPTSLPDSRLYKQIGNSVTISVVERIARNIRKALETPKKSYRVRVERRASVDQQVTKSFVELVT